MKYIIVLMSALCMFVMPVSGEQVNKAEQPMQGTTVKQVHSESKTVLSDDLDTFHVNSSHTPDHVIGQGGLEMPDSTDKKTTRHDWCSFRNARIEGETVDAANRLVIALSEKLEALVRCGNIAAVRSL
ncbi:MAG: hypothetical protein E6Z90_02960 [Veillonella sp.]|nr:hypothetical protein [Veillonella sp.]